MVRCLFCNNFLFQALTMGISIQIQFEFRVLFFAFFQYLFDLEIKTFPVKEMVTKMSNKHSVSVLSFAKAKTVREQF